MKNIKSQILIFILVCLIFIAKPWSLANAQGIDLGIYPPIFEINVTPPADIKVPFFIQNYSDSDLGLTLSLKPFTAADSENGQVSYLNDVGSFPDPFLFNRIQVLDNNNPVNSMTISVKQKKNLSLHLHIPSNEPKGEYYFSLIFTSSGQYINESNMSEARAGIASNVLLSIGPLGKPQGIIEEFSSPFFLSSGPVPFTVRLKNTSDHFLTPTGNILIKNMFGQTIGKIDLLPVNVLSNTIRRIPDSLQSPSANQNDYGKIKDTVEKNQYPVAVWPENFLLGQYTATLTLALTDNGPVYTRSISFFAFPIEYIIGIILIIGMVVFIVIRVRNRINR